MKTYKKGDVVVHGREIGTVIDIVDVDGVKYYKVQSLNDPTLSVRTPVDTASERLRPTITRAKAEELIDQMIEIEPIEVEARTAEVAYNKLITSGDHVDIVRLIKTSYMRCEEKTNKGLPRHEKDKVFLRMAERLLYSEFAVALGKTYKETEEYVLSRVKAAA